MKNIKFRSSESESLFSDELKKEVSGYFATTVSPSTGNSEMISKCAIWLTLWIASWCLIIVFKNYYWIAVFVGLLHMFSHIMIAFNITHDANHGAMFKSKRKNVIFGYLIELLGCNRKMWIIGHNKEHHSFINIHKHDNNIEGYKLLRLSPQDKWFFYFKFQWLYAPIIYGLATFNYATVREIKLLWRYTMDPKIKLSPQFYLEFVFFKMLYYSYLFIIPIYLFGVSFKIILVYFLVGHFINGLFLTLIFLTGHLTENTHYPKLVGNVMDNNWAVHVIKTTGDYSTKSTFMQWLVGGINLHVAHHLFPKICHVHYKKISPIIKKVAISHGYLYREIPSFSAAIKSHFRLLKELSLNN